MLDTLTREEMDFIRTLVFAELQDLNDRINKYNGPDEGFDYLTERESKFEKLEIKLRA